jgi:hypothetical protein
MVELRSRRGYGRAVHIASERGGLLSAVTALVIIGVALIALAPGSSQENCDPQPVRSLTLRRNADPDIPILKQAKAEYAKLH